ncbi:MAG: asparaginase domain-containing protein [Oscillospiraceae bacterium]|nr:asparaginase domain-containing protein [Oscillospiraceae bacterium]
MKILTLHTGGTFAMTDGAVRTLSAPAPAVDVIDRYKSQNPNVDLDFEVRTHTTAIASENMTIPLWNGLIDTLRAVNFAAYNGVIITHGTDTLAYTAALLSVVLAHVKIPVVLVSSNAPLTSPRANGYTNFRDAVDFIRTCEGRRGVFATYFRDGISNVLLGEKITQPQPFLHNFKHFDGSGFGILKDGKFASSVLEESYPAGKNIFDTMPPLTNSVLLVMPYVGLDYSRINFDAGDKIRAVLHGTYHSYTMCVDQEPSDTPSPYSAEYLIGECNRRGIPLYFASCEGGVGYESNAKLREMGAKFMLNTSVELAYARLLVGAEK